MMKEPLFYPIRYTLTRPVIGGTFDAGGSDLYFTDDAKTNAYYTDDAFANLYVTNGGSNAPQNVKITTEGDSITNGLGATGGQPGWPGKTVPSLMQNQTLNYTLANIATSGYTIALMDTNFNARSGAQYDNTKEVNLLTIMGGANDGAYDNPIVIYKNYRRIVRKARIAGYNRVVVGTLISRSNGTPPGPNNGYFDAGTLLLNDYLRSFWNTDIDADGIIDWGSNPLFDTSADADNTTYYADKLHPTNAGYDAMAAQAVTIISSCVASPGTRGTPAATFFPIDVTDLTLSNGDKTVTRTAAGNKESNARGAIGKSSGKWYWEMVLNVRNTAACGIFVFNYLYKYMGNRSPSSSELSIGLAYNNANGGLFLNNVALTTQPTTVNGDIIQWAMDATNMLVWMKRSTDANWNGSGAADPATGTGGISFESLGLGPYYPQGFVRTQGGQVTSRFSAADMTGTIPTGFLPLSS